MKNNCIYLYDGTISTLMDLIIKLLKFKIKPLNICAKKNYEPTLLDETVELDLNTDLDLKKINISKSIFKTIYYIFLSNEMNKELIIYYFLLNAFKYHEKVFYMRNLNCVTKAIKIYKYVSNENHKLKGFLRFKEINSHVLYSEISPENNILELLSHHFANRLKNEYWIIKDTKRNMYSFYNQKKYYIINDDNIILKEITSDKEEKNIEDLWITFFETIGIEARRNKRCQMNFMPKKYWKNMLEMRKSYEESNNG